MREPTVVWWPGTIPAGTTCDEVMTAMDLLPTFAKMVGGTLKEGRTIDGKEIGPLLLGVEGAKTPHESFFYHQADNLRAVRSGKWKCFRKGELYDLSKDIGEKKNIAAQHPEVVARLQKVMDTFDEEMVRNSRPVGVAKNSRTLVARPGVEGEEGFRPTLSLKATKK
jgi:arylsulfatase A-like enzyme